MPWFVNSEFGQDFFRNVTAQASAMNALPANQAVRMIADEL
jgi:hypothetical protein